MYIIIYIHGVQTNESKIHNWVKDVDPMIDILSAVFRK